MIAIKRVYDVPDQQDGYRVLVDRLWPRGLTREAVAIDHWAKVIAPSNGLRQWYDHRIELWPEFQLRYRLELATPDAILELERLRAMSVRGTVTLLTATRNQSENHAIVLSTMLQETA